MRFIAASVSALALAVALSAPAWAQEGTIQGNQQAPLLFVVPAPGGTQAAPPAQSVQPDPGRVIILTPQAGAAAPFDFERFARELTERAYLQGRIDERQATQRTGAAQLSQADLERLATQLFERGYLQGRFEGQLMQAVQS